MPVANNTRVSRVAKHQQRPDPIKLALARYKDSILGGIRASAIVFFYCLIGVIWFKYIVGETKGCVPSPSDCTCDSDGCTCGDCTCDSDGCTTGWTIIDALYFSMVSMSTVGYGDLSPADTISRLFCIFYILVGVTFVFTEISDALNTFVAVIEEKALDLIDDEDEDDGIGEIEVEPPDPAWAFWTKGLFFWVFGVLFIQCTAAILFQSFEDDVAYGEALYHCMITGTTVGYGDISLTTQEAKMWAVFHIAISVSWMAALIGKCFDLADQRKSELERVELMTKQLDKDLLISLDEDGGGVDRIEFVIKMLMKLDLQFCGATMTWADVKPFLTRFDYLDGDKDGRIFKDQLAQLGDALEARKTAIEQKKRETMRKGLKGGMQYLAEQQQKKSALKQSGTRAGGQAQEIGKSEEVTVQAEPEVTQDVAPTDSNGDEVKRVSSRKAKSQSKPKKKGVQFSKE